MIRLITGFHQDDDGDWVAQLSCLHNQHVRHRPPFFDRPWVTTRPGREARLGSDLECPLCDRAELPAGLDIARTAGPFDASTLPDALRHAHRIADRTWGCLRVLEGSVHFTMETTPPVSVRLAAGDAQAIPPGVLHALGVKGNMRLEIDSLVPASADAAEM